MWGLRKGNRRSVSAVEVQHLRTSQRRPPSRTKNLELPVCRGKRWMPQRAVTETQLATVQGHQSHWQGARHAQEITLMCYLAATMAYCVAVCGGGRRRLRGGNKPLGVPLRQPPVAVRRIRISARHGGGACRAISRARTMIVGRQRLTPQTPPVQHQTTKSRYKPYLQSAS